MKEQEDRKGNNKMNIDSLVRMHHRGYNVNEISTQLELTPDQLEAAERKIENIEKAKRLNRAQHSQADYAMRLTNR